MSIGAESVNQRKELTLKNIQLFTLDFDGVVWGSELAIYEGVVEFHRHHGREPPSFKEVWQTMSAPYVVWWREREFMQPEEEIFAFVNRVAKSFPTGPKPDAIHLLEAAYRRKIPCYIVSATSTDAINEKLERSDLVDFVAGVFGHAEHNKAEMIRSACWTHNVALEDTVFIGDRPSDVRDGKEAGVYTVAYTGGHETHDFLTRAGPDHVTDDLRKLIPLFFGS